MKKLISLLCVFVLVLALAPAAFAVDLSGMSYDELVALKDQINLAIWNSAEWQEVEVPQGVWEVGADIPAGKWTIKPVSGGDAMIYVGRKLEDGGASVDANFHKRITDPGYHGYDASSSMTELTIELKEGQYVQVDWSPAVFTPYAGKPSLGFK